MAAVINDDLVRRARERKMVRDLADLAACLGSVLAPP